MDSRFYFLYFHRNGILDKLMISRLCDFFLPRLLALFWLPSGFREAKGLDFTYDEGGLNINSFKIKFNF